MEIILRTADKIRLQNHDATVFADIRSNTRQYGMDVTFYSINNKLQLIEKERTYKMFLIPNDYPIEEYEFGWWKDGNVVWQNF